MLCLIQWRPTRGQMTKRYTKPFGQKRELDIKTHRFYCVLENGREFGEHFVLRLDQFLPRRPREFLYLLLPVAASIQIGGFMY